MVSSPFSFVLYHSIFHHMISIIILISWKSLAKSDKIKTACLKEAKGTDQVRSTRMHQRNVSVRRINIIVSIIFVIILGVSVAAQVSMNKKNSIMSCESALDQAEDVIENNTGHGESIEEFIYKLPYTDTITTYLWDNSEDDSFIHTEKKPGKRYYSGRGKETADECQSEDEGSTGD